MNKGIMVNDLIFFVFGVQEANLDDDKRVVEACVEKAYRDMCRTIDYKYSVSELKGKSKEEQEMFNRKKNNSLKELKELLIKEFSDVLESSLSDFGVWHENLCNMLTEYTNSEVFKEKLTVGQAQKWINMTIKYLRILGKWDEKIKDVHIPIDEYIMSAASIEKGTEIYYDAGVYGLGVQRIKENWSKITDYESYKTYQKNLREACTEEAITDWEAKAWIAEATSRS